MQSSKNAADAACAADENSAQPLKPWRTPTVIIETIKEETDDLSLTGSDADATIFTRS